VGNYSPPWYGFFVAPAQSAPWGAAHEPVREAMKAPAEMSLLLGFVLLALAFAGLFISVWSRRVRISLGVAVAVSVFLAMGTTTPGRGMIGYGLLHAVLPGWNGLRTPGRLVLWTTLLLGILAAGAIGAFAARVEEFSRQRHPYRPHALLRLAMVLPLVAVLAEGWPALPHPAMPGAPAAMREAEPPLLVLPVTVTTEHPIMLWSTDGFPAVVNGISGFTPRTQRQVADLTRRFPDADSIGLLRRLGIRTVIVLRREAAGTPYERALDAPVAGLGVRRDETADAVIYRL